jgi:hypothetical protein
MGKIVTGGLLLVGVAGGIALALAARISRESGKSFPDSLREVPERCRHCLVEMQTRARQAVASGRQAAREKEEEIDSFLHEDGYPGAPDPPPVAT